MAPTEVSSSKTEHKAPALKRKVGYGYNSDDTEQDASEQGARSGTGGQKTE